MKKATLFAGMLIMLSGCGLAGRTLGTATRILTSPVRLTDNDLNDPIVNQEAPIIHAYTE